MSSGFARTILAFPISPSLQLQSSQSPEPPVTNMETGGTAGFQWSCQNSSLDTLALSIIVISSVVYCLYRYQRYRWSSFNNVPGLPDGHWLWGVLPTMLKSEAEVPLQHHFQLSVCSRRASPCNHRPQHRRYVLSHPEIFPKPDHVKSDLISLTGGGLLAGETHHRQRRLLACRLDLANFSVYCSE
ncbi:hypothetical protein L202_03651 [Cryptococcus amylolentus CBS 6039]|uniref:Uncharacterized protein n=1 Tax=Cryptococcus amylolentus CBS 6039 TaxID=1295533 RepID=A0A1E3HTR9_9TREE|nr:hypothetical protein L202_03651 [Cryptococcus amylolentus CBS 6039]ODN79734.1 hypothetical protein L202_03651 [Cryptococcus amylolentus CBS 6039]